MSGQDVLLQRTANGVYDLVRHGRDYARVESIETACLVALFTDARADQSLVDAPAGRRGWVGNIINNDGRELGGLLWVLDQARITRDTINAAEDYAAAALGKLVADGVCRKITARVIQNETGTLDIIADFVDNSGNSGRFSALWRGFNAASLS